MAGGDKESEILFKGSFITASHQKSLRRPSAPLAVIIAEMFDQFFTVQKKRGKILPVSLRGEMIHMPAAY